MTDNILNFNKKQKEWNAFGKHIILEIYTKKKEELNDRAFIKNLIINAAKEAKVTLLNYADYKFSPKGITAILLLAESHISIHTWPDFGYAAVDIYTCGGDPEKASDYMIKTLQPHKVKKTVLLRGEKEEVLKYGTFN